MTPSRVRATALLAPIAVAGLVLLSWTRPWAVLSIEGERTITAGGDVAAPALPALALASLALVAALALAGPVFRIVLGALQMLLSSAIITSAALVIADPVAATAPAVTELSGVSGEESVRALVQGFEIAPWPYLSLVCGALGVLVGAAIAATARRWPERGRRYDALRTAPVSPAPLDEADAPLAPASGAEGLDRLDAWDTLSDGRDPTAR